MSAPAVALASSCAAPASACCRLLPLLRHSRLRLLLPLPRTLLARLLLLRQLHNCLDSVPVMAEVDRHSLHLQGAGSRLL